MLEVIWQGNLQGVIADSENATVTSFKLRTGRRTWELEFPNRNIRYKKQIADTPFVSNEYIRSLVSDEDILSIYENNYR